MKLVFEKGNAHRGCSILPGCDVPGIEVGKKREIPLHLPCLSENEISRHYSELEKRTHGVNNGFYPLGSCTMKYNPKINNEAAALSGFVKVHPLQPEHTVEGCREALGLAEQYLCEITGMDGMTFLPAAGAHGEFTGLLLMKAYHVSRNDKGRTKIIIPDSAHGTNPASATMAGYTVITIPSREDGCVDLDALRAAVGPDTAGLMLTNPNTVGLFDKNILEITEIIHDAGGLCYYDGANLNAVMGIVRPGDMGFDVIHLNLHKTFSTPHGGGGPGSGPVGCKEFLVPFLPEAKVKEFHGNFLVVVRALAYIMTLGREGIPDAARNAVLNANYMKHKLEDIYPMAYGKTCMHEFVMTIEELKKETGVSAMDIAKALLDYGIHPPTMYFPLIVPEALMVEPTETESKETLDEAIHALREIYYAAKENPRELKEAPHHTPIRRPDEVQAARKPVLRYQGEWND